MAKLPGEPTTLELGARFAIAIGRQHPTTEMEDHLPAIGRSWTFQGNSIGSNFCCLIPYRSPIEFTITLRGEPISRPIKLTGTGEVVRVEPGETVNGFGIAIACSQPITQIEDYLTARA